MKQVLTLTLILCLGFTAFAQKAQRDASQQVDSPPKRTPQTEALYKNLKKLVTKGQFMFGQANPTTISYLGGVNKADIDQSDCKDITGSHPAFYESDFMWYVNDKAFRQRDLQAMRQAFERGGVVGYSWHIRGMKSHTFYAKVNGQSTTDQHLVTDILSNPNRSENPSLNWLLTQLDSLVIPVFQELGFPIVFRPWHEMNGNWFFLGSDNCSPDEYKALYRLTVNYIRSKGVENILYSWSPDKSAALQYYPGDAYVDVLGMDIYEPGIMPYSAFPLMVKELGKLTDYAYKHGKVAAITEPDVAKPRMASFGIPISIPHFGPRMC